MWNDRAIAIGGVLFAAMTAVSIALMLNGLAVGNSTNADTAEWLSDSGHRTMTVSGLYLMCAGGLAFMLFATGLVRRLRAAGASDFVLDMARIAAGAFTGLQIAAGVAMGIAAISIRSGVETTPVSPDVARIGAFGFELWFIGAALCGAAFVATVSVSALANGALPRWLALVGLLCAAVLLGGIAFLPGWAIFAWAICVAIAVSVRSSEGLGAGSTAATA